MYCTRCGVQIEDTVCYCPACGHETPRGTEARRASNAGPFAPRRLYRLTSDKKIAGICSGLARYFDIDPTLVRLVCAALVFVSGGLAIPVYLVAWMIVPPEPRPLVPYPMPGTSPQATS